MPKEAIYTTILVVPSMPKILEDAIAEDFYLNTYYGSPYGETCSRKLGEISAINKRGELCLQTKDNGKMVDKRL
jgi:hypothetical protein